MNMKKKISNIYNIFPLFSIKHSVLIYSGMLISSCSNGANYIKHREYIDKCKGGKKMAESVLEFPSKKSDIHYVPTIFQAHDTEYITQNLYQDKKKLLSDIIANILRYNGENLVSHVKTVNAEEETYISLKGDKEKLLSVTINDNGDSKWKLNIISRTTSCKEYGYNDFLSKQLQDLFINYITFGNYDENLKAINDILYEKLHNLQSFNGLDYKDVKSFFKKNFENNFVFERIDTDLCGNKVRKYKCLFPGLIKYSIEVEFFVKEGNDNKSKLCYRFTSYNQNIATFKYQYWDDTDFKIPFKYVIDQRVIYRANEILNKIFHNLAYDKGYFKNENHYVNTNASFQLFKLNSNLTFIPNLSSSKSEILRVILSDSELNIILNDEVLFRYNIQPFSEVFDVDTIVDQFRETNEYRKITEFFTQIPRINLNKSRTRYNTFFS